MSRGEEDLVGSKTGGGNSCVRLVKEHVIGNAKARRRSNGDGTRAVQGILHGEKRKEEKREHDHVLSCVLNDRRKEKKRAEEIKNRLFKFNINTGPMSIIFSSIGRENEDGNES